MPPQLRLLVCGDRHWTDQELVDRTLDEIHAAVPIAVLIEGEAKGADTCGRIWAETRTPPVPVLRFPAQWKAFGKAAGPIRNQQQLDEGKPNLVVAFHDNLANSKGTAHMVRIARAASIPVKIVNHVT